MNEKNFLKAKDARAKAEFSNCLVNHVYKSIKDAANDNLTQIEWVIEHCADAAVINLKDKLEKDGYSVDYLKKDKLEKDGYSVDYLKIYNEYGEEEFVDENILVIKW